MRYFKMITDGYLISVGEGSGGEEISFAEYNAFLKLFAEKPDAQDGYKFRLCADSLEWELVEVPEPEPIDESAEISDYENALSDLGVRFGD